MRTRAVFPDGTQVFTDTREAMYCWRVSPIPIHPKGWPYYGWSKSKPLAQRAIARCVDKALMGAPWIEEIAEGRFYSGPAPQW